ncbi:MAG: ABC transporter permease subunit [Roseburia sp.]
MRSQNNIITIIKKEFSRFFGDKRLLFTTLILPGMMIFILYSFMGKAMRSQFMTEEDYVYGISVIHTPQSFLTLAENVDLPLAAATQEEAEEIRGQVQTQEQDILLVFPEGFDEKVAAYDSIASEEAAPNVEIYYNSASTPSSEAYQMISGMLEQYETAIANKFDINAGEGVVYDLATKEDSSGRVFSMMLPMLLMIFLFSGCMAIAPESIAGEKERGTIATLLVTPMKRRELAIGKLISLSVIGLLSGLSSFLGTMLSMPMLMGELATEGVLSASVYTPVDFLLLLITILSTVLVIIGLISILSAASKSVKEAGTAASPLMVLVLVISATSMMGKGAPNDLYLYLIPFYNSVQCMNGIFSFSLPSAGMMITIASNLFYTVLMVGVLAKMFDSEKIMYQV